jgi:hypothetical protein
MKIELFQQQILDGFRKGELNVISSGRQTGKSLVNQYIQQWEDMQETIAPKHMLMAKALVDGEMWYTIRCHREISNWIRTQPEKDSWYEHIDSKWMHHRDEFDISEEFYMLMVLKFGK